MTLTSMGVSADDRESRYLTTMEQMLNSSSLFYSRISPEVATQIKPAIMPPEAEKVAKCVVSNARSENLLEQFDETMEISERFTDYIRQTPTLTLKTVEQDEGFKQLQAQMLENRFEPFQNHAKECGMLEMSQKITKAMGIFEAIRAARE